MCVTDCVNYQRLTRTFVIPIKGDKRSTWSSIKNDLINALSVIKMNQPEGNSKEAKKLITKAAFKYKNLKRRKEPGSSTLPWRVSNRAEVEALSENDFELEQEVAKTDE